MEQHRGREIRGRAQNVLGRMYQSGDGVPAIQGHEKAQYRLGVLCEKGVGIPQDIKEAEKWKLKAAQQGEPRAQNYCGVKYAKGKGVQKDFRLAYMWLFLAATQGNSRARKNFDLLAERMTPDQLSDANQMIQEWKPKT
jgi:TPR repeat protein